MKRIRILIAAAILILVLGVWHGCHKEPGETPPNRATHSRPQRERTGFQDGGSKTEQDDYARTVAEKSREFSKAMNRPIEFYGRTVDQDGRPLVGVSVDYHITSTPTVPVPWGPSETTKGSTGTDADGQFVIKGHRGHGLSFSLRKDGYRERGGGATYSANESESHHPDPAKPVAFTLIRDDLPLAEKVYGKNLSFVWNAGQVTVNCGPALGSLVLTPKRNGMNTANRQQSFDWSVDVVATGFGMALLSDETAKVAPTDGYQPGHIYDFPRDAKAWRSVVTDKYTIRTADGKYGLMELALYGDHSDNGACGSVTIYLNPSGARNIDHK